jgi:hypothetical protein
MAAGGIFDGVGTWLRLESRSLLESESRSHDLHRRLPVILPFLP